MDKLLSMYKSENMESKQPLLILGCSRKDNIQMDHKATRCNYVDWVNLEQELETHLLLFTNTFCTNTFIILKTVSVMKSVHKQAF